MWKRFSRGFFLLGMTVLLGMMWWVQVKQNAAGETAVSPATSAQASIVSTLPSTAVAQESDGITDPDLVATPAPLSPAPVGDDFSDPVFGTTLRRLTGASDNGGWATHIYSQLQAFSADNAYVLLIENETYVVRELQTLALVGGLDTALWNAPRWHPTQAHTLIHYDGNDDTTLRLQFTNVDSGQTTTMFTFPAPYERIRSNQSFDEISRNGRWLAGMASTSNSDQRLFAFNLETMSLGAELDLSADLYAGPCEPDPDWGEVEPDWVGVSPLGNYMMVQWTRDGSERCSGLETFDLNSGAFVGRVYDGHQHGDLGVMPDGTTEFFMTFELYHPSGSLSLGYRLLPGTATASEPTYVQVMDWMGDHISCRGMNGACLITTTADPSNGWSALEGELFLQFTDGSVQRLTHHRSTGCGYWVQPRASWSGDGRFVIFASDWQQGTGGDSCGGFELGAGDAYLIDLGADAPAANVRYVCDCDAEADAACVAGNDGNSGDTPAAPWQTYEQARTYFNANIAAGDEIRFCRGGAFDLGASSGIWRTTSCTAGQPCVIADYAPPWGDGSEPRPILWKTGDGHGFEFSNGGNALADAGYVLRNLDLRCTTCATTDGWGVFLFNDVNDVLIDNVRLDGFAIGVHSAGSNPCDPADLQCNGRNDRLTVRNATITNNFHQGFLGGGDDLIIEGSYFENNGDGSIFDHNIYLSYSSRVQVRGNELYRSSMDGNNQCGGTSLVAHGHLADAVITENYVHEDVGGAGQGCWGIAIDPGYSAAESFTNVTISGNRVENVGNVAIGLASCANCTVENNSIIHQQPFAVTGIAVPDRAPGPGDSAIDAVSIRNNSIVISGGGTAVSLNEAGTGNHLVVSNAIEYTGSSASWNCFDVDWAGGGYTAVSHNICGFTAGEWVDGVGDLAAWQALGWGENSIAGLPGFSSSTNLFPAAEDVPLVDAGHPTLSSPTDANGDMRDSAPDAGAYEWMSLANLFLPLVVGSSQ
ncbi:MAG: right-handed parallel beta-helix repeat-containing protein [Chloroflexota bacterium]